MNELIKEKEEIQKLKFDIKYNKDIQDEHTNSSQNT